MDISAYQHMNIRMSTRGKRPLRNLTPSDKVRAIQRIHNGETKASVSRDIGVPESTLRGWCKNEQKLRFMCHQLGGDGLPMSSVLEKPPEKRIKFESSSLAQAQYQSIPKITTFSYNHIPLHGVDLTTNTGLTTLNPSISDFVDNIAFEEFVKKNAFQAEAHKEFAFSSNLQYLPITAQSSNVSQLAVMQNLNLLSFLAPLTSKTKDSNQITSEPQIRNNITKLLSRKVNCSNDSNDNNNVKRNEFGLSVKEWAKEPFETYDNCLRRNVNDSNNNDVKSKRLTTLSHPEDINESINTTFASPTTPVTPKLSVDVDPTGQNINNNNAVFEWCKVFNASLSFLALAAAAASLQPAHELNQKLDEKAEIVSNEEDRVHTPISTSNVLVNEMTKTIMPPVINSPPSSYIHCDGSNDSYYDSEPEDLSIRSTASKLSSPANSRSQSPTKSCVSSCSAQSDADE